MIQPFLPMLATSSAPFDSSEHFFEVKWDGIRALAAVQDGRCRLWGRELSDYDGRYPELDALRALPSGTVVDGELVTFHDGRPDLNVLLQRHQLVHDLHIRRARLRTPVHHVLFDVLYQRGRSVMPEPFAQRRQILAELCAALEPSVLLISEGVAACGRAFFEQATAQGHEGVMAKQQSSRYLPGRRCAAWQKIKPTRLLPCVIIGYTVSREGLHSVLVASADQGPLRYVGRLTRGFGQRLKTELSQRLASRRRPAPVVACTQDAVWVEPELYCRVRFLPWTPHGRLQHASFAGLMEQNA